LLRAAVALTAVLALGGCGAAAEAPRDASGRVTAAGSVRADHIRVGDCYDDGGSAAVGSFAVVPCSRAHDNEVFFLFAAPGDAYPGQDALAELATRRCTGDAFSSYTGTVLETSSLQAYEVLPTEDTWTHDGDREVVCVLASRDRSPLRGSVKA
jgi:hypothetical protein